MIKAKNYATAVTQSLKESIPSMQERNYPKVEDDIEWVTRVTRVLKCSQHFSLPDNGLLIGNKLKGLELDCVRLPFQSITLECDFKDTSLLIIAREDEYYESGKCSKLAVVYYHKPKYESNKVWTHGALVTHVQLPEKLSPEDERPDLLAETVAAMPNLCKAFKADPTQDQDEVEFAHYIAYIVLDFCEALSCSNVTTEVIQKENKFLNAKRIKKSKIPFSEIKTLVLKTNRHETILGGTIENRSGPRQHLRRGHIRRLPDGRKIWVNSCLVGDPSKGSIKKVYDLHQ